MFVCMYLAYSLQIHRIIQYGLRNHNQAQVLGTVNSTWNLKMFTVRKITYCVYE